MKLLKKTAPIWCLMLSAIVIFAGAGKLKAATEKSDVIANGVYIGSVDVGGMTREQATAAIEDYLTSLNAEEFTLVGVEDRNVVANASDFGITADADLAITRAEAVGKNGNLINRFKQTEDLKKTNVVVDMNLKVDQQKTANFIYKNRHTLDIEAVNTGLVRENGSFTIVEGKKGKEVDCVQSVYAIQDYITNEWNPQDSENSDIALVVNEVEPKGSKEELEQVKDVLGTFTTDFSSSSAGRKKNVSTGCSKINGTILYPGDELSAYGLMNPFTEENGYALAGSYANGTTVESFGGGICQVSTTLYNAAIRAEVEVVKRFNHSMVVGYVDRSADAAIAGDYKDLKLRNNFDTPIYIEGYCSNGKITFNIFGKETRPANRQVSFESETLETKDPGVTFSVSADLPAGVCQTSQSAHIGYEARLWKVVTVDGVEQSREIFNTSSYRSSPKIVIVGIGGASPEQAASIQAAVGGQNEEEIRAVAATVAAEVAGSAPTEETPSEETPAAPETPTAPETPSAPEAPAASEPETPAQPETPAASETPAPVEDSAPADQASGDQAQ